MLEKGVFVEAGDLVFQSALLPNLYTPFFEEMLEMFLQYTSRTVPFPFTRSTDLAIDRNRAQNNH